MIDPWCVIVSSYFKRKRKNTKLVDPRWIINNHKKTYLRKCNIIKSPSSALLPTEATIFIPVALCPVTLVTKATII